MTTHPYGSAEQERALAQQRADRLAREAEATKERDARERENARKREQHIASIEAERQRKRDEHDAVQLAALKDRYRSRYLTQPGATPERFEAAWPELLEEHRRREAARDPLEEARRAGPYF